MSKSIKGKIPPVKVRQDKTKVAIIRKPVAPTNMTTRHSARILLSDALHEQARKTRPTTIRAQRFKTFMTTRGK